MRRSTWILGLAMMVSSGCAQEALSPVEETSSAVVTPRNWALGWVDTPATGHVSTTWQATSSGAVMTGARPAPGRYEIYVPGMTSFVGGNVLVTPYATSAHCGVVSWNVIAGALKIDVQCFAPVTGAAVDAQFVVSYVLEDLRPVGGSDPVRAAYMWYSNGSPAAEPTYRWSSIGGPGALFTTTTTGTGKYRVEMHGMTAPQLPPGGVAQVTAYGAAKRYCNVTDWANLIGTASRFVDVRCFDPTGALANSAFALRFWTRPTWGAREGGYAVDISPSSASFTPAAVHQSLFPELVPLTPISITRPSAGSWDASVPAMTWTGSGALVGSLDPDGAYCTTAGWNPGVHVQVRCFSPTGAAADARFTVAYLDGVDGP